MTNLKKTALFIQNCVEIYIPMLSFLALFLVFCFQVFMRYVARNPQSWTLEVEQMCFLWLVLLGACFAQRERSHVTFTLVYDNLGIKGKAFTSLLGNLIISFTFLMAFVPSLKYIWGQQARAQVTSILKISKTLVFFPFVFFLGIIVIYAVLEIFESIMVLKGDEQYIKKMIAHNKTEAELAIEAANAAETIDLAHIDYENNREKEDK